MTFDQLGFLRLTTTGPTDLYGDTDTAPKVMRPAPSGNWDLVTHMQAAPDVAFEHAGLLVVMADGSWLRLIRDSNQDSVQLQGGSSWTSIPFTATDLILRLEKSGAQYSGWVSEDGVSFVPVGTTTVASPPATIGVVAVSTPVGNVFSADFEYFRLWPTIFKDGFDSGNTSAWSNTFP